MTQAYLRVIKSPTPPVGPTYQAHTMWLVPSTTSGYLDIYISNADGTAVNKSITMDTVTNAIALALANYGNTIIVNNIAERDALTLTAITQVYVLNATADNTVATGAAIYLFNPTGSVWTKIQELATIDAVVTWSSIQNGPSATPAAIDDAVAKKHAHTNSTQLAKVGEDAEGFPTYGGNNLHVLMSVAGW